MLLLEPSLAHWLQHGEPSLPDFWPTLRAAELAVWRRQFADQAALDQALSDRLALLTATYPQFQTFAQQTWDAPVPLTLLWQLWLPLGISLVERQRSLQRPLIQGILGGQGTGKTTLTQALAIIFTELGRTSLCLSIDDLYKTYADRQRLQAADPRLIWRGPPGTHDVKLGIAVIDQVLHPQAGQAIAVPRFDKSLHQGAGDRTTPELLPSADILLFEGWFVGARPIAPQRFDRAPAPIQSDGDRQFARDNNERLQAYEPLWDRLDQLMVLLPEDYRFSKRWRQEAEQRMKATGKAGMSDAEIAQFVDYFWTALHPELFIEPLARDAHRTDLVVEIDVTHRPRRIYRPD